MDKPRSIDELRKYWEERTVKHQASIQIMLAGFQTEFWGIFRREMETRKASLQKGKEALITNLGMTPPTTQELYQLCYLSSEIQVYQVLLGLEEALRAELDRQKSAPKTA